MRDAGRRDRGDTLSGQPRTLDARTPENCSQQQLKTGGAERQHSSGHAWAQCRAQTVGGRQSCRAVGELDEAPSAPSLPGKLCQLGAHMSQPHERKRWVPSDQAKQLLETIFTADSFPTSVPAPAPDPCRRLGPALAEWGFTMKCPRCPRARAGPRLKLLGRGAGAVGTGVPPNPVSHAPPPSICACGGGRTSGASFRVPAG